MTLFFRKKLYVNLTREQLRMRMIQLFLKKGPYMSHFDEQFQEFTQAITLAAMNNTCPSLTYNHVNFLGSDINHFEDLPDEMLILVLR